MADRPFFGFEVVALGVVEGFFLGIVSLFLTCQKSFCKRIMNRFEARDRRVMVNTGGSEAPGIWNLFRGTYLAI